MYKIKNGILYHDDVPELGIGQSYFASYHPQKVPVGPGEDAIAKIKGDVKAMKAAGFNICRMAALGEVAYKDGKLEASFPLADCFCDNCLEADMAAMIRLQGYDFNLHGYENAIMLDNELKPMEFHWSWFVRNCLCHEGIYQDNKDGTAVSAAHFDEKKAVVSYQIYCEPAYPHKGLYDYNPKTVEAFFKKTGHQAPRQRPRTLEDLDLWIEWKLFLESVMEGFLCDMADVASSRATLTCHTTAPFSCGAITRGQDYFETAKRMDILGITHYIVSRWPDYHHAALCLDAAESIAALFGKHAWIIEYNARTNISSIEFQRQTYNALGRGIKAIMYYQWRADYPYPDSPEPEAFGMIYNNGSKTKAYDDEMAMVRILNRLSTSLAIAERVRSSIAILCSSHANAYFDGIDNWTCDGAIGSHDRYILAMQAAYARLNEEGLAVNFVRSCDLGHTPYAVDILIIPASEGLSETEKDEIDLFEGKVYEYDAKGAFYAYQRQPSRRLHGVVYDGLSAKDLGLQAPSSTDKVHVDARVLKSGSETLVCLVNYDENEKLVVGCRLKLADPVTSSAVFYSLEYENGINVSVKGGVAELPDFLAGGILVIKR